MKSLSQRLILGFAGRSKAASQKRRNNLVQAVHAQALEPRLLFAAVSWTGSAGDNIWTTPTNWSGNAVPGTLDDVTINIAGTPLIRITTGNQSIKSLNTAETLSVEGGTLAIGSTATFSANLTVGGGALSGGTYTATGGAVVAASGSGGSLTNVLLIGDVVLAANTSINVSGTTKFTTARLQGSNANINLAPGYTLASAIVAEGVATGTRYVTLAVGGAGANTISATGSVRLASGSGGDLTIRNSSTATLINNGLISAEAVGQSFTISNSTFQNNSTTQVTAGTLSINATSWKNSGTLSVAASAVLNIGGIFNNTDASGSFGTFANSGGTINVTGTIDNTGSAFTLNSATGSFVLLGGTIANGDISYANGQSLLLSSSGGTLNGVAIAGEIVLGASSFVSFTGATTFTAARLQGSNANINLGPGFTLNSPIIADGASPGTRFVTMAVGGTGNAIVGANGSITLASGSGGDLTLRNSSASTLINNGLISAEAAGMTLSIFNSVLTNNATLRAMAGTLTIGATSWTNAGTISLSAGTIVNLGGTLDATRSIGTFANSGGTVNITGTVNNTSSSFGLNTSTGSFVLLGGTITGGAITYNNGQSLQLSSSGGTLSSVSVSGDLILASNYTVTLAGNTSFTAARLQGSGANISMVPGYTLSSLIVAEGIATGTRFITMAVGGTGSATIASGGVIRLASGAGGDLTVRNSSAATLVNSGGTISAEASSATLTISTSVLTNSSTLQSVAGNLTISATNWTNAGTITASTGSIINIGGTFNATSGIGTFANSGGTINITGAITNTGATLTLSSSTGSWTLLGGTITGGSIAYANSQSLLLSTSGGTLSSVSIAGDIILSTSYSVLLVGNTSFTAARLQGSNASINLAPGFTLSSPILSSGASTGTRFVTMAVGGSGTVTIASGGSITLASGSGGDLNIRNSSAATLVNNGIISSEQGSATLSISTSVFTNNGIARATVGSLSITATNWTNPGTVGVSTGATVNLGGTFDATAGIGMFANTGGTINITGTLANANSSFTLDSSTGSFTLLGGTIAGGSIAYANGQSLLLSTSNGTLSNVAIAGDLVLAASFSVSLAGNTSFTTARLQGSNANINMAPGYTLNSTIIAEGGASGTRFITLAVGGAGTVTLGPSAIIRLGSTSGGDLNFRNSSAATLINNGLISAESSTQILSITNSAFTNNSTAQSTAGILRIAATISKNSGTLAVSSSATLTLAGTFDATTGIGTFNNTGGTVNIEGTLNNTGSSFTLNASTGSFTLIGGTISGGSLTYANGQSLLLTPSGGTLSSIAIAGDLVLGTNAAVLLTGTTTFIAAHLQGSNANINIAAGYTLASTIVADGAGTSNRFVTLAVGGAGTVTLASTAVIRLDSSANAGLTLRNSSAATLINNGLISAESSSELLTINPSTFTNDGMLQALGGTLSVITPPTNYDATSDTLTGGSYSVSAGGFIRLTNVLLETLAANVTFGGATSMITGGINGTSPLIPGPLTISATGTVALANDATLSLVSIINSGTLALDSFSSLNLSADFQTSGTLSLTFAGNTTGAFGRLMAAGHASLSGTLLTPFGNSFEPVAGQLLTAITAASLAGTFSSYLSPTSVVGSKLAVSYTPTSVILARQSGGPPTTPALPALDDTGTSNSDHYTSVNTPTLTGSTDPGATVSIFDGATLVGSSTAGNDGIYSITLSPLSDGTHTLTASAKAVGGTPQSSPGTLTLTIDTTAPVITPPFLSPITTTDSAGAIVNFVAIATDATDPSPTLIYSVVSGSLFAVGITPVTLASTDLAGNSSSSQFNVTVSLPVIDPVIGGLDGGFGNGSGVVSVTLPATQLVSLDSFILSDGHVQTAGFDVSANQLVISQFNADGSLDTSFGAGGSSRVTGPVNFVVRRVQFAASGNIYLFGTTPTGTPGIVRYSQSGTADTAFGSSGLLTVPTFAVGDQIDSIAEGNSKIKGFLIGGTVNLSGTPNAVLINLLPNFTINTKFGTKGQFARPSGEIGTFNAITITLKSLIFVAGTTSTGSVADNSLGSSAVVIQLSSTGKPAKFGSGTASIVNVSGYSITSGQKIYVQADGKVLISAILATSATEITAGRFGRALIRLTTKGALDTSFNGSGSIVVALPTSTNQSSRVVSLTVSTLATSFPSLAAAGSIGQAFDMAESSFVVVGSGRVREIAAVPQGLATNIVQSQVIADAVDLVAGAFTFSTKKPYKAGSKLSGALKLSNAGTLMASGTVPITLYFSADSTFDSSDSPIPQINAKLKLKPSASLSVKIPFIAPDVSGSYFVIAIINQGAIFSELKLTNNQSAIPVPFVVSPAPVKKTAAVSLPNQKEPLFSRRPVDLLM